MKLVFRPVGVSSYDLGKVQEGDDVTFIHQPGWYGSGENKKEYPNAVGVYVNGEQVGSLAESTHPESPQQLVVRMIKNGQGPIGKVSRLIIPTEQDQWKTTLEITMELPDIASNIRSFNEVVDINFYSESHKYFFNEKQLVSASSFVSRYVPPFNAHGIASGLKWGVDKNDIIDLWKSNGDVTRDFGTAIHQCLEHYDNFRKIGETITATRGKGGDNYALPKHPFLREVITSFLEICKDDGNVLCEVPVSNIERGLCGTIDRLVLTGERTCRIADYKINVVADESKDKLYPPFSHLPSNKLSKYQLQLSFYAQLMRWSGWVVEGIDVYVHDGKWNHYQMEVLDIEDEMEKFAKLDNIRY